MRKSKYLTCIHSKYGNSSRQQWKIEVFFIRSRLVGLHPLAVGLTRREKRHSWVKAVGLHHMIPLNVKMSLSFQSKFMIACHGKHAKTRCITLTWILICNNVSVYYKKIVVLIFFLYLSHADSSVLPCAGRTVLCQQFTQKKPEVCVCHQFPACVCGSGKTEQEEHWETRLKWEGKLLRLLRRPQNDWVLGLFQLLHCRAATTCEYEINMGDKWINSIFNVGSRLKVLIVWNVCQITYTVIDRAVFSGVMQCVGPYNFNSRKLWKKWTFTDLRLSFVKNTGCLRPDKICITSSVLYRLKNMGVASS